MTTQGKRHALTPHIYELSPRDTDFFVQLVLPHYNISFTGHGPCLLHPVPQEPRVTPGTELEPNKYLRD